MADQWLISYRYEAVYFKENGDVGRNAPADHVCLIDEHPIAFFGRMEQKYKKDPQVMEANYNYKMAQCDHVLRIYSCTKLDHDLYIDSDILEALKDQ